jgi:hypothetical protein
MVLEKVTQFKFGTFLHRHVDPVIVCTHLEGVEGACRVATK